MQVFKTYFIILRKRLFSIIIYAAIFLSLTLIMTFYARNEDNDQFNMEKVELLLVNEDGQNSFIDGFRSFLEKYVTYVEIEDNEEARKDALFFHDVEYILTIPEGFTDDFFAGREVSLIKQTVPDSINAVTVDNVIDNYFNTAKVYLSHIPSLNYNTLNTYIENSLSEDTAVTIHTNREDEQKLGDAFNLSYYNYLAYIIIAVFILGVSSVMLSFHDINIRRRHYASPVTIRRINFQLILSNIIFVSGYLFVFIAAGLLFNPSHSLSVNTLLFWLNAIVFALAALSISYLIGITVKSKKAVSAISTAFSLSMAFLSGVFVPQEFLGEAILRAASFTPTYWYIRANNRIAALTNYGWDNLSGILASMVIQIGFAAAIVSIALVVSKRKSRQAN